MLLATQDLEAACAPEEEDVAHAAHPEPRASSSASPYGDEHENASFGAKEPLLPRAPTSYRTTLTSPTSGPPYADSSSINVGFIPFLCTAYSPTYRPRPLEHTLTTSTFASSPSCLEQYIASGTLCASLHGRWSGEASRPKIDAVWTWVNGSSAELMAEWRHEASRRGSWWTRARRRFRRVLVGLRRRAGGAAVMRHFREHDELRFSIRSVLTSVPASSLSTLHIVVGDTPAHSPDTILDDNEPSNATLPYDLRSTRLAQIPRWSDLSRIEFSDPTAHARGDETTLRLHPHSELFKTGGAGDERAAAAWKDRGLPSFNSLAIESQLAILDFAASTALYLNDDCFLHRRLALTDVSSPLSGPVFRMQRDLLVTGVSPQNTHDDKEGEWRGLGYTAWLLDERFGKRGRPYLVHVAKTVSPPLLREMQQVFLNELTATAESRFRGQGPTEVQTLFLLTHYTIEKHREALLWSFLVARSDSDRSGTYSSAERLALLASTGYNISDPSVSRILSVPTPLGTTRDFSSLDGYAFLGLEASGGIPALSTWPSGSAETLEPPCTLDLVACFGDEFLAPSTAGSVDISVSETFHRVVYEQPHCGDCLIALLVGKSGPAGLEAFLPPPDDEAADVELEVQAIALEGTRWSELDFSRGLEGGGTVRQRTAALIHRYSYTLGSSAAAFESISSGGAPLSAKLGGISAAFVALNDDVLSSSRRVLADVDARMGEWFRGTWPVPSPWERTVDQAETV